MMQKQVCTLRKLMLSGRVKGIVKTALALGFLAGFCGTGFASWGGPNGQFSNQKNGINSSNPQKVGLYNTTIINQQNQFQQQSLNFAPPPPFAQNPVLQQQNRFQQEHNRFQQQAQYEQYRTYLGNSETYNTLPQEFYRTIIDYCKFSINNNFRLDSHLVGQAIRKLASSNANVIYIEEVVPYVVQAYDRLMNAKNNPLGNILYGLKIGANGPSLPLDLAARSGIQSFLDSLREDAEEEFAIKLTEETIVELVNADKEGRNGIKDRMSVLLALNDPSQKNIPNRTCSRSDPFSTVSSVKDYKITHALVEKARSMGFTISPFSKRHSARYENTKILSTWLTSDQLSSAFLNETFADHRPMSFLFYMLLLAIKDTQKFGFQEDIMNYIIETTCSPNYLIEVTNNTKDQYHLKHCIIRQELMIQLSSCQFAELSKTQNPDLLKYKQDISNAIANMQEYINKCFQQLNIYNPNQGQSLVTMLIELRYTLINLGGGEQLEEIKVLDSILDNKMPNWRAQYKNYGQQQYQQPLQQQQYQQPLQQQQYQQPQPLPQQIYQHQQPLQQQYQQPLQQQIYQQPLQQQQYQQPQPLPQQQQQPLQYQQPLQQQQYQQPLNQLQPAQGFVPPPPAQYQQQEEEWQSFSDWKDEMSEKSDMDALIESCKRLTSPLPSGYDSSQSVHFQDINALCCYEILSKHIHKQNKDLYLPMRDDCSDALKVLYTHVAQTPEAVTAFAMLVNSLENSKIELKDKQSDEKRNIIVNTWDRDKNLKSLETQALKDNKYVKSFNDFKKLDKKYEKRRPNIEDPKACEEYLEWEKNPKKSDRSLLVPKDLESYKKYKEYQKYRAYLENEELASECLRGHYNNKHSASLTNVLNFTINYLVYVIGLDKVENFFLVDALTQNLTEAGGCLNGFIDRFYVLISSQILAQQSEWWEIENTIKEAIDNYKENKKKIDKSAKKEKVFVEYENVKENFLFTVTNGKDKSKNRIKAANFFAQVISNYPVEDAPVSAIPNTGVLSRMIAFALDGDANSDQKLNEFLQCTCKEAIQMLQKTIEGLKGKRHYLTSDGSFVEVGSVEVLEESLENSTNTSGSSNSGSVMENNIVEQHTIVDNSQNIKDLKEKISSDNKLQNAFGAVFEDMLADKESEWQDLDIMDDDKKKLFMDLPVFQNICSWIVVEIAQQANNNQELKRTLEQLKANIVECGSMNQYTLKSYNSANNCRYNHLAVANEYHAYVTEIIEQIIKSSEALEAIKEFFNPSATPSVQTNTRQEIKVGNNAHHRPRFESSSSDEEDNTEDPHPYDDGQNGVHSGQNNTYESEWNRTIQTQENNTHSNQSHSNNSEHDGYSGSTKSPQHIAAVDGTQLGNQHHTEDKSWSILGFIRTAILSPWYAIKWFFRW